LIINELVVNAKASLADGMAERETALATALCAPAKA
jgi:hypothetical protein